MRSIDIGGDKWVETEFFDWDDELSQLALVGLHHVSMGPPNLLQLVLEVLN